MKGNRTDDFFRFKSQLLTSMESVLPPENMIHLNDVLDRVFENISVHYTTKEEV